MAAIGEGPRSSGVAWSMYAIYASELQSPMSLMRSGKTPMRWQKVAPPRGVNCGAWGVNCGAWSVNCGAWGVNCGPRRKLCPENFEGWIHADLAEAVSQGVDEESVCEGGHPPATRRYRERRAHRVSMWADREGIHQGSHRVEEVARDLDGFCPVNAHVELVSLRMAESESDI
jgi:hypothetical protein